MKISKLIQITVIPFLLTACSNQVNVAFENKEPPSFIEVTVHDPSIIQSGSTYYVFGSHLASAKSVDLMHWTQISTTAHDGNPLIPNVSEEMAEALKWAQTNTFWAPDVIQLNDGRYYMYYCNCRGDSPLSCLGIAVSDEIEGPYSNLGILLKSGMLQEKSPDGAPYNANLHPNVVDPHVFFDKEGTLWMIYGSYSGGIFIMEMDPDTGFPRPDQGYGKKLLGGYHARIEGPYVLYSPDTDYYYLFLSFGGLDATGAYNIRVARSKNPDGPYLDAKGQDMIDCKGMPGILFHDPSIQPYGTKLMGNYKFLNAKPEANSVGYLSPGHNSALYDEELDKYFMFFHTRFENRGEHHEVRVHQMFLNQDGWPVVAPYRYAGETVPSFKKREVPGQYQLINHGNDITNKIKTSVSIELGKNGKVTGSMHGNWAFSNENELELNLDGTLFKGVLLRQWDTDNQQIVITFTALSSDGVAIWGSKR